MSRTERYKPVRPLGEHDGVTTVLAEDSETGAQVVHKTLALKGATAEQLEMFEREARTLKALHHARVPRLLDSWRDDADDDEHALHFIQAYVPGESLEQASRAAKRMTEDEIFDVGVQAATILAELHALRPPLIHRDLKPSNLVRTKDGAVHLIDFGAATLPRPTGRTVVGTYGYMPPEQYEGRALPASDVYSLGMTLVFLFTHAHPWEHEGGGRAALDELDLDDPRKDVVARMIASDPAARPTAGEVARLLAGAPAPRVAPPIPARRSNAAVLVAVISVIALLIVVGVGAGAFFFTMRSTTTTTTFHSTETRVTGTSGERVFEGGGTSVRIGEDGSVHVETPNGVQHVGADGSVRVETSTTVQEVTADGEVRVGQLDRSQGHLMRVVKGHHRAAARCLKDAAVDSGSRATLVLVIDPSGRTKSAKIEGDLPAAAARCVTRTFSRARFPRADEETHLRLPLVVK